MRSSSQTSHIIRYGSIVLGFIWILLSGYLYYEYLVSKTWQAPTKWWTLIEWVTTTVSYTPYVSNSSQDRFYQNLLFKSCQSFFTTGWQVFYDPEACDVISNDNKTFVVSILGTGTRSDGAPVSIDDVLFTYQDILQQNKRWLPHGTMYENLVIQKLSTNSLTITFPRASKDNIQFFTNFLLPAHILKDKDWNWYTTNFASNPVTNWCAKLGASRDSSSLIFDVWACSQTWLKYYQVKKTTVEKIQENPGIIDMYLGPETLPWYNTGTIVTNDYAGIFFNMQRGKLSIYGRKNMISMVNKYIYLPENDLPIVKEHFLFDNYPTSVTDKSTISGVVWTGGRITVLYYTQDEIHNHIANIMKSVVDQEGLAEYFEFIGKDSAQEYTDTLQKKDYDITIQTLALWVKKDISSLFLTDDPLNNPSLYVNPNLASQIKDYFQSPLYLQYSIMPIISKLYSTDLPFFMLGKRISYVHLKPSLTLPLQDRRDEATVRYKIFHSLVSVYKPQVTKQDILNGSKFGTFILSELGF